MHDFVVVYTVLDLAGEMARVQLFQVEATIYLYHKNKQANFELRIYYLLLSLSSAK